MSPSVAVLIACHNRRTTTLRCLAALSAQRTDARLSAVLFDDGSTDGTAAAVRRLHPAVTVLVGRGDAFWSGGMRAAFDHALEADFDAYLWLNDDVVLDEDAVARMLAAAEELGRTGHPLVLLGGAVCDPGDGALAYGGIMSRGRLRFEAVGPFADQLRPCSTLHGNVVLVPGATARAVGSIGQVFVHGLGDLDYGLRVGAAGGWVGLVPGFIGSCPRNPGAGRWFDPAVPYRERWRLLAEPKGFPLRPWLAFARAHGGLLWPAIALRPLLRLLLPAPTGRRTPRGRAHASA